MFARITPYQLKPGVTDAAMAKAEELKDRIMALPGILSFTNAVDENGRGYVIATVTDRATSDASADQVKALWSEMGEFLAAPPTPEGYDNVQHWDN